MKPNHHRAILEVRNAECGMRSGAARIAVAAVLFYSALCIPHSALGAWVTATNTHNIVGHVLNTKITFTPTNDVLIANGGLSAGPAITTNIVNGRFTNWLDGGNYTVTFPLLPFRKAFSIAVPTDTNSYDITSLMNPPRTYIYTNNLIGIATQVRPGANVTFTTNNAGAVTEYVTVSASVNTTGLVSQTFLGQIANGSGTYVVGGAGVAAANGSYNFDPAQNRYTIGNFVITSNAVPAGKWTIYGEEGNLYTNDNAATPIGNWSAVNASYNPAPVVVLSISNQLMTVSNAIVALIPSTNGFVGTNGLLAATNGIAVGLSVTNGLDADSFSSGAGAAYFPSGLTTAENQVVNAGGRIVWGGTLEPTALVNQSAGQNFIFAANANEGGTPFNTNNNSVMLYLDTRTDFPDRTLTVYGADATTEVGLRRLFTAGVDGTFKLFNTDDTESVVMAGGVVTAQSFAGNGSPLTFATAPANSDDPGTVGQIANDGTYFYVCIDTDTWKRVLISDVFSTW